jgi:hypothetical protein
VFGRRKEAADVRTGTGVLDSHELPYVGKRRALIKRRFRLEPWIFVIDALLVVLIAGDFANLFMAVETALRSGYVIIFAISISLTGLCVILPFLAGKLWRKRVCGVAQANYPLVVILIISWLALLVGVTLLRLAVDGLGPFAASSALDSPGVSAGLGGASGGASGGAAIASLGSAAHAQTSASDIAVNCMLAAMLAGSGIVAFISAWAAADPLREKALQNAEELLARQEAYEELVALKAEYEHSENYYRSLGQGDQQRYNSAQETVELIGTECKHEVRARIASDLCDPASTSALILHQNKDAEASGDTTDGASDGESARALTDRSIEPSDNDSARKNSNAPRGESAVGIDKTTIDKSKMERGSDENIKNITKLYSEFDDLQPAVARS